MNIDKKYWSYCKEIGIMEEHYSHQQALDSLIKEIKAQKNADPAFVAVVSKLTLNSQEVSVRSCMLYRFDIELTYSVNGRIEHGRISDFGDCGVYDSLHITEYKGDGDYRVLQDFSSVPYIYNERNLFTLDEMKHALKDVISKKVPSGTTSYESEDWSVSAYIVPVLSARVEFGGKVYDLVYNLQNGWYRWDCPDNPALINKGKKMKMISLGLKALAIALPVLGIIIALTGNVSALIVVPILILIANIIIAVKTKKKKQYWERYFVKQPDKSPASCMVSSIVMCALAVVAFIIALA